MRFPLALPALLVLFLSPPADGRLARDLEHDVASLLELRDAAPLDLIRSIAVSGELEGLEGLISAYGRMGSAGMRIEVLRASQEFASAHAEQLLPWLEQTAATSRSAHVLDAALDAVAACGERGRAALRRLANGDHPDALREGALERHARDIDSMTQDEVLWYLRMWQPEAPARTSRKRNEDPLPPRTSARMRRQAFAVVLPKLGEAEIGAAIRTSGDREIRQMALRALDGRGAESCVPVALEVFSGATEQSENRAFAAEILWKRLGPEITEQFIEVGTDNVAPLLLRYVIADLLAGELESKDERALLKKLRSGHEYEQLFALRALGKSANPKVVKEMLKLLGSKRPNVALFAIDILHRRREASAGEPLAELVAKGKDRTLAAAALTAWSELERESPEWRETIEDWTTHRAYQVRAAAYREIANAPGTDLLPILERGLAEEEWPCQWAALLGVESLRSVPGAGLLIERMQTAEGRLRHELSEALWRLTGQTFGDHPTTWAKWFEAEAEGLSILDASELERLAAERLAKLLGEQTVSGAGGGLRRSEQPSEFFGVRVQSDCVVFVVDVSGSMERTLKDLYDDSRGLERFGVALTELRRCLDVLQPSTTFTIVAFSAHLKVFEPDLVHATEENIAAANRFLGDLDLGGGTDVWEALNRALDVEDVDTIYLLSDGEPEGGAITDPVHIRMAFRRRNTDRAAVVHSIAFGDELPLLRWLAEDTGGTYTRFR